MTASRSSSIGHPACINDTRSFGCSAVLLRCVSGLRRRARYLGESRYGLRADRSQEDRHRHVELLRDREVPSPLSPKFFSTLLLGPRLRCIESMPAGGAEPERLQKLLRNLRRVNPGEPEGRHASRVASREQLLQTGATVLDKRAERDNLSALHIEKVGLDSLVGGDGESCDVVLPCRERLDRALPANLMDVSRRSRR